ncbi:hypothetical protein [Euzebya tangerina]|uniref:hypothetical protein n=1 Tax=Euzebya tangerina TaxID=591198 RepID=UPI000E3175E7|nr:hypothetical protein [Euzebya tangerina]
MSRLACLLSPEACRRALARDDGQTTTEWLGVGAVSVAVILALMLSGPALGRDIQRTWNCFIAMASGNPHGTCSFRAPPPPPTTPFDFAAPSGEPERDCTRSTFIGNAEAGVRIGFVDLGGGKGLIVSEDAQGQIHVTFVESGSIGVSADIGAEGGIDIGSADLEGGIGAEVGVALGGEVGETRVFTDPDEAEAYIMDRLTDEALETILPPLVEDVAVGARDVVDWIVGTERPQGEAESTHGQAGVTVEGSADGVVAEVDASVAANGRVTEKADGSRTLQLDLSREAAGQLGILVGVGASGGQQVQLEVDYDPAGNPTTARIISVSEGTVEVAAIPEMSNPADVLRSVRGTAQGGTGSRTVVTAELDLTAPGLGDALGDFVGSRSVEDLSQAADVLLDHLRDHGTVSIENYTRTAAEASVSGQVSLVVGLGIELGLTGVQLDLTDAAYYDPETGRFIEWIGCTGGP